MSDFIAERIWPDACIERSIFGTDDPRAIWAQVLEACPDAVDCFAFEVSVGALFGLRLRDGSRIALKVHVGRVETRYLEAVQRVQEHLAARGFPCPQPLGVRERVTLEEWRDEGVYRDAHEPEVRGVVAGQLAELFRVTDELQPPPGLEPYFAPPDALNTDFETVFVGGSAATFTYTEHLPVSVWPTLEEAAAFLEEYEQARTQPFAPEERAAARAAAVYSRAYSARCTHAVRNDATRMQLREYAEAFL